MEEAKWLKKKEKALKENNKELLYESYKKLAEIYQADGKLEESLSYFKRALNVCEKTVDIAVLNRWIGEIYCDMGMFEEALKCQKRHLELSKQDANNVEIQRALATLGRTYFIKSSFLNNREKQKSLQMSYDYYLKSEETCNALTGDSSLNMAMMKARLYLNIGLTLEALGRTDMAYFHKAVAISKAHDLNSELTLCYTRLAEVYLKQQKHSEALTTIQKCMLVGNNQLDSSIFCELLLLKSDTHVDMFDFASAKMNLIQAYKLKHLKKSHREEVEKKLKLVVVLVRNENKLMELDIHPEERTDVEMNQVKKIIYEQMGDACAALSNHGRAVHFYHKMLNSCEAVIKLTYGTQLGIGLNDSIEKCCTDLSAVVSLDLCKDLASCYVSLAKSYKDNKQYSLAVDYFTQELSLHSRNYSEACQTLQEMCDLYILQEKPYDVIYETYNKALSLARENSDVKLERMMLRLIKKLCQEHSRTAELETIKTSLKSVEDQLECDSSSEDDAEDSPDVGDTVRLDELSDLNSEDETQEETGRRTNRKRTQRSHYVIKRNDKGETALHVAAMRGNLSLVRTLLKQGHPVNVQDSAGWLPLHEAANHGHTDIVAALLDAGADPNDKGGTGISPLHDAASNGNLAVIECLLEKGASVAQRTDQGETALFLLEQCKARVERTQGCVESNAQAHFEQVVRKLQVPDALIGEEIIMGRPRPDPELIPNETRKPLSDRKRHDRNTASMRNKKDLSLSPCNSNSNASNSSEEESATKEYQKAISNLRYQQTTKYRDLGKLGPVRVRQRQKQFLEEAEVGDDWLEEDVSSSKKRKYSHDDSVQCRQYDAEQKRVRCGRDNQTGGSRRKSNSPLRNVSTLPYTNMESRRNSNSPLRNVSTLPFANVESNSPLRNVSTLSYANLESKRKSNSPLREMSTVPSNGNVETESSTERNSFEASQNLFPEDANDVHHSPAWPHEHRVSTSISSIKIKIESHVFLIPIVEDEASKRISWLKQEASERYYRLEGVKPVLRIKTQDGALIDEQDPLVSIRNESIVHTEVVSWNKPPIIQRYRQLCLENQVLVHHHFEVALASTDTSVFTICPCAKSTPSVHILFKTFAHWSELVELHLARSFLQDKDINVLAQNMAAFTKLQKLNLSCNHIQVLGMTYLSEHCSHLSQLQDLDVSFNPLSSACLPHINNMVASCPQLRVLNLSSTQLTVVESNMNLYNIQQLNISRNKLGAQQIRKLLSLLNAEIVVGLNLSSTLDSPVASPSKSPNLYLPDIISMVPRDSEDPVGITREVVLFLEQSDCCELNRLELSNINMKNEEARLLHEVFVGRGKSMLKLDVSCNPCLSDKWVELLKSLGTVK